MMIVSLVRHDLRNEFDMADEVFALSPISARAVLPSEEDYDAISQAFMETSRGRWFLGGGLGPSFGPHSGLAGKLFAGINFTPVVSLEAEAQFPPESGTRAVIMLRFSAL